MILGSSAQSKENLGRKVERSVADQSQTSSVPQSAAVSTQPKSYPSSTAIMRNRMAFFSVPSQPVRINARAFLGLETTPPSKPGEKEEAEEVEDVAEKPLEKDEKPVDAVNEEKSPAPLKDVEANRKRHGRREPAERAKRWRKRRKKRRVTGHVTGGAVAEKHAALPVVSIEGVSSDEDDVELADVSDDEVDKDHEVKMESVTGAGRAIFYVRKCEHLFCF